MTYLQMVNNILKRLREREVSSVNENSYSALIGVLINDAKQEVEDSWDWSALRTTLTVTTSEDTFNYELNGSQNKLKVLDVWNATEELEMRYADAHWMNKAFNVSDVQKAAPIYYSFNSTSNDGDTLVDLYPIPDNTYTLYFNCVVREDELSDGADVLRIPQQPVLLLAYAKAIEERGEDAGVGASSAYMTANRSLNDAISMDAIKHPEELIWREV